MSKVRQNPPARNEKDKCWTSVPVESATSVYLSATSATSVCDLCDLRATSVRPLCDLSGDCKKIEDTN